MPYTVSIQQPDVDFLAMTTLLQELGYRQKTLNDYSYFIEHRENTAHIAMDKTVTFQLNDHLSLSALEKMRRTIIDIKNRTGGTIEEADHHIGYLQDGTKASLFRNWEQWVSFLHAARFNTIQGSHVRVYDKEYKELGKGVLLSYEALEDTEGIIRIQSCMLKTEAGPCEFSASPYLIVEATGEWVDPEEV